ncbi:MAG: cation-efflux pump [Phycisphaerales bacterium]|nr:MAG: cation-efflux pump [Phycisphaerales bacterium]
MVMDYNGAANGTPASAAREKKRVALTSVVAAIFLTSLKIIVGLATGSLGILAEALHSALDLAAAMMTYLAVRIADRPADAGHQYGHGKVESFSALFETLLLVVTCVWIIWEAFQRLFFKTVEVDPTVWAFAVMITSIIVDWGRSRALLKAARKHKSQALEADALHFSTDIWSSSVVLLGLALVKIGEWMGHSEWLARADALAALGVAGIVLWVSGRLGKATVDVLLDRAPEGVTGDLARMAEEVDGVVSCPRVRARQVGPALFVDMVIEVGRATPLERAHAVVSEVETRVRAAHPQADIVVHFEPVATDDEGWTERVEAIAGERGLAVHEVQATETRGRILLTFHLEIDPQLCLAEAHELADELEADLKERLPDVSGAVAHIEPKGAHRVQRVAAHRYRKRIAAALSRITEDMPAVHGLHEMTVRESGGRIFVAMHCVFDGARPIGEVHRISTAIEDQLKTAVPEIADVHIHAEPPE